MRRASSVQGAGAWGARQSCARRSGAHRSRPRGSLTSNAYRAPLKDLASFTPAPAERCIYCGATEDLRDEHILPFGLSGPAAIPRASCGTCARITGAVEGEILRGPLWPLRVFRNLKSRTRHRDAPRTVDLTLDYPDGRSEPTQVPIERAPVVFIFPVFAPPGIIQPRGYTRGIRVKGSAMVGYDNGYKRLLKDYGASSISLSQTTTPSTFARMIAKIAYAMAFADGSIARIGGTSPIISSILGESDDVGFWVGSFTETPPKHPKLLHHMVGREYREHGVFAYEVQLFADLQAPHYSVVLGNLPPTTEAGAETSPA